jgi:WD40 repeat protein
MTKHALVIGIAQYQSFPNLPKAADDAEAIAHFLEQHQYKVSRLPHKRVSDDQWAIAPQRLLNQAELSQELRRFLCERNQGEEVLLYIAGHGFQVKNLLTGELDVYLATSDSMPTGERAIALTALNTLLAQAQLTNLVVLLDTCYAGALLDQSLLTHTLNVFKQKQNYYFITACRRSEYAWEGQQHGIFTKAVLAGLQIEQADLDGNITGDRLFDFIRTKLQPSEQEPIRVGVGSSITIVSHRQAANQSQQPILHNNKIVCPYQGLQFFTAQEKDFFFGRGQVVEKIKQELNRSACVIVTGVSGSGKSSVIRAGLVPWLEEEKLGDESKQWKILEIVKPEFEPLVRLRRSFEPFFPHQVRQLKNWIEDAIAYPDGLNQVAEQLPGNNPFLLVIDQFEQLFAEYNTELEQKRLIELITQVTTIANPRFFVVILVRADFINHCLRYPTLQSLIQEHTVWMPRFNPTELVDVISEPAKRQGFHFAKGLIGEIQHDIPQELGSLPLLEFALTKLWESRDEQTSLLTSHAYTSLGGLRGALNLHAEHIYQYLDFDREFPKQSRSEQERLWIKRIFLKLVRIKEEEKPTHHRQTKEKLLAIVANTVEEHVAVENILEELVRGRLLVAGEDGEVIDLAHEALIEGWERFSEWIKESRTLLRLIARVEDAQRDWVRDGCMNGDLMKGSLLSQVQQVWQTLEIELDSSGREFVERSQQYQVTHVIQGQIAKVTNLRNVRPVDALVLAIQVTGDVLRVSKEIDETLEDCLRKTTEAVREQNVFNGYSPAVHAIALHWEQGLIVSADQDSVIRIWDTQGNLIKKWSFHPLSINSIALSPKGNVIAIACSDGAIRLLDHQKRRIRMIEAHTGAINSVIFSTNGQLIISASADKTIRVWDQKLKKAREFKGHTLEVNAVSLSSDNNYIVSAGADKKIQLRSLQEVIRPVFGVEHTDFVNSVAFSPNSKLIVSGSADKTVRLWKYQQDAWDKLSLEHICILGTHDDGVMTVAFSPDGETVASGGSDGLVRVWDVNRKSHVRSLRGHEDSVRSIAYSRDQKCIVSGSDDGKIRIWDVSQIKFPFRGHVGTIYCIAFDLSGKWIASGGAGAAGTIRLWDNQGNQKKIFRGHTNDIRAVAFSPDGNFIVSGSADQTVRLWNIQSGIYKSLSGHDSMVRSVAVSPNSHWIASASSDKTVRLWNFQGDLLAVLEHRAAVMSVAFSQTGAIISGSDDGYLYLWQPLSWELESGMCDSSAPYKPVPPFPIEVHDHIAIRTVTFSPDGKLIVTAGDDCMIQLWDLEGNLVKPPFRGHTGRVRSIAFSPHGDRIVSGSNDKTVRLWNLEGQQVCDPMHGHIGSVRAVAFDHSGDRFISCSSDESIRLWDLKGKPVISPFNSDLEAYLQAACNRLRYHPAFQDPQSTACKICQRFVWH